MLLLPAAAAAVAVAGHAGPGGLATGTACQQCPYGRATVRHPRYRGVAQQVQAAAPAASARCRQCRGRGYVPGGAPGTCRDLRHSPRRHVRARLQAAACSLARPPPAVPQPQLRCRWLRPAPGAGVRSPQPRCPAAGPAAGRTCWPAGYSPRHPLRPRPARPPALAAGRGCSGCTGLALRRGYPPPGAGGLGGQPPGRRPGGGLAYAAGQWPEHPAPPSPATVAWCGRQGWPGRGRPPMPPLPWLPAGRGGAGLPARPGGQPWWQGSATRAASRSAAH